MKLAIKEAENALEIEEVPVGCVIVSEDLVIGKGYNQVEQLSDPTAHAELIAISSAAEYLGSRYLSETTLYTTLEPCVMCLGAIKNARISKLVFSTKDTSQGFLNLLEPQYYSKIEIFYGILEKEAKTMLTNFFNNLRF